MTAARLPVRARLADLFRGHRRLPDPPDLVGRAWFPEFGDGQSVTEALRCIENIEEAIERDAAGWDFAAPARRLPARDLIKDEHDRWYGWGDTTLDTPPAMDRPYIPGVLGAPGRLSPLTASIAADIAGSPLFRASLRNTFVRQEIHVRKACTAGVPWQPLYDSVYRERTGAPLLPAPDFDLGRFDLIVAEVTA